LRSSCKTPIAILATAKRELCASNMAHHCARGAAPSMPMIRNGDRRRGFPAAWLVSVREQAAGGPAASLRDGCGCTRPRVGICLLAADDLAAGMDSLERALERPATARSRFHATPRTEPSYTSLTKGDKYFPPYTAADPISPLPGDTVRVASRSTTGEIADSLKDRPMHAVDPGGAYTDCVGGTA
jgi:hypothetical protein